MRLVVATTPEQTALAALWVASRIPAMNGAPFGPCAAMMIFDNDNNPAAGVIFHDEAPQYRSVSISIASVTPKWLSKRLISGIMSHPFVTLRAQRVTAVTAPRERAASVVRFLTKFGFREEGRVRRGLGDTDAIVWGLLAEEWAASPWNIHGPNRRGYVWRPPGCEPAGLDVAPKPVIVEKRRRRSRTNGTLRMPERVH